MTLYVKIVDENPTRRSARGEAESFTGALEAARSLCHHYGAAQATIRGTVDGESYRWLYTAESWEEQDD